MPTSATLRPPCGKHHTAATLPEIGLSGSVGVNTNLGLDSFTTFVEDAFAYRDSLGTNMTRFGIGPVIESIEQGTQQLHHTSVRI